MAAAVAGVIVAIGAYCPARVARPRPASRPEQLIERRAEQRQLHGIRASGAGAKDRRAPPLRADRAAVDNAGILRDVISAGCAGPMAVGDRRAPERCFFVSRAAAEQYRKQERHVRAHLHLRTDRRLRPGELLGGETRTIAAVEIDRAWTVRRFCRRALDCAVAASGWSRMVPVDPAARPEQTSARLAKRSRR